MPESMGDLALAKLEQELRQSKETAAAERKARQVAEDHAATLSGMLDIATATGKVKPRAIKAQRKTGSGKTSALLLATDWHSEENIDGETIGGLNEFHLTEADSRIARLFPKFLRMIDVAERMAPVEDLTLWLGGDLINGYIHEELQESNFLGPAEAIHWVQDRVAGGIDMLLRETKLPLRIVCNYGNHGRSTQKRRVSTGYKTSWEWLAYKNLERTYAKERRVTWNIAKGYFAEEAIQGQRVRFHHGDNIRFQGGVGGITIPVNKAIAQWNKAKPADLDIFGHYHQWIADWRFISVGCLCGYNAYAQSIKAEYQPPTQGFAVLDRERGLTAALKVFVDEPKKVVA